MPSEGEKEKIIQQPENAKEHPKENENQTVHENEPFPSRQDLIVEEENNEANQGQYGRGCRQRRKPGEYKVLNEGLTAAIAHFEEPSKETSEGLLDELPPDFALVASHPSDPTTLDEALRGPDAKKWLEALDT